MQSNSAVKKIDSYAFPQIPQIKLYKMFIFQGVSSHSLHFFYFDRVVFVCGELALRRTFPDYSKLPKLRTVLWLICSASTRWIVWCFRKNSDRKGIEMRKTRQSPDSNLCKSQFYVHLFITALSVKMLKTINNFLNHLTIESSGSEHANIFDHWKTILSTLNSDIQMLSKRYHWMAETQTLYETGAEMLVRDVNMYLRFCNISNKHQVLIKNWFNRNGWP